MGACVWCMPPDFFAQSKSGRHGYNIIRWTRPPFSPVFAKNKRNRPPFSPVFIKNKRTRPPFSSVFAKNKRNHPPFSSVFEKNRRSKELEQSFSRKTDVPRGWNKHFWEKQTFQGVGTIIFEKNRRSKGLEQPFSRKTMRRPRTKHTSNPFSRYRITPPRIFLLPLLPQIQIQIRYYGDWFR